ncbi:DUF4434 domain-containing protein [Bailinhaonella thermotolerans]|uniref:DUF4434 domain-containing protein n=1 Tax=Bailinhaonella thermotolerans TaxID=1070861 RepID=A0A3A4AUP5_9ACTN|nr:DUF4434 domain-containing protein [Bailinhaonella thermotolerans]RJL32005.1 DUF4434 domain-containing protein [Bailinhaonella thermotolerans]
MRGLRRWFLFLLLGSWIAAAVGVVAFVAISPGKSDGDAAPRKRGGAAKPTPTPPPADPCGERDLRIQAGYPVSGFFFMPKKDRCLMRAELQAMHRAGGDTVVRFGYAMQPRDVDRKGRILDKEGRQPDETFACVDGGKSCFEAAMDTLTAANPANRLQQAYVFRTDEYLGSEVLRCPSVERSVTAGAVVFHRMLVPSDGSDDPSCNFSKAGDYDLILVRSSVRDYMGELLDEADRYGMKVYPALPMGPRDPRDRSRADPEHIPALETLTRRTLQDYQRRYARHPALAGVYQGFEIQLKRWKRAEDVTTLQVYAAQHRLVRQELPGRRILVSPYLDGRKKVGFGATPDEAAAGFRAVAETGADIIAPQDGHGTGKVGLYFGDEADRRVPDRVRRVVGDTTYGEAYRGSTRDFYRLAAAERERLSMEGRQVELWANVEAFEPDGIEGCSPHGTRGRTDKARLDTAIALAGPYVNKIISYMWTDFYTCRGTHAQPLGEEILADWNRPIVIDVGAQQRGVQRGILVRGYNLDRAKVTLRPSGGAPARELDASIQGWVSSGGDPLLPRGNMSLWVPYDWEGVDPGSWIQLELVNSAGKGLARPFPFRAPQAPQAP